MTMAPPLIMVNIWYYLSAWLLNLIAMAIFALHSAYPYIIVKIYFQIALKQTLYSKYEEQAQESLAAAMSLNIIVTSWADDCIETTDYKLLQPSTGNKQQVTYNLYPLTFAFKGKP